MVNCRVADPKFVVGALGHRGNPPVAPPQYWVADHSMPSVALTTPTRFGGGKTH